MPCPNCIDEICQNRCIAPSQSRVEGELGRMVKMGFFSWKTADTDESIANIHAEHKNTGKTVYLLQPNNQKPIEQHGYEGFGVFGGVSVFAWLAKMNISDLKDKHLLLDNNVLWEAGLNLLVNEPNKIQYPLKFSFSPSAVYEQLKPSEKCSFQGFFYMTNQDQVGYLKAAN